MLSAYWVNEKTLVHIEPIRVAVSGTLARTNRSLRTLSCRLGMLNCVLWVGEQRMLVCRDW